ncbi:class F sortase [Streptomyces sp. NPDC048419]|uniref:class F sortase n=1 Tax=Streptomyces sp. NPDC048419 TaxID=3365547 RepID=UPI00370F7F6D
MRSRALNNPVILLLLLMMLGCATYVVGLELKTIKVDYAQAPPPPQPSQTALVPIPAPPPAGAPALNASPPVSIDVPRLGIHAEVMTTGLNEDGTLAVPSDDDARRAAWYEGSSSPGQAGPAVIVGHVDSWSLPRGEAVFYPLGAAKRKDEVDIARADGTVAVFSVDSVSVFSRDSFPTGKVYAPVPDPELRLITCGGAYTSHGYSGNVIVFAHYTGTRSGPQSTAPSA